MGEQQAMCKKTAVTGVAAPEQKKCSKCKQLLAVVQFGPNRSLADGLDMYCRTCRREDRKRRYAADPAKYRGYAANYAARHPDRITEANRKSHKKNAAARSESQRRRRQANLESVRARDRRNHLKYKYGLTPTDRDAMEQRQHGRCAICGKVPRKLHIDHCHATGLVRQLLCSKCNVLIGYADEDPAILAAAIAYLQQHALPRADAALR